MVILSFGLWTSKEIVDEVWKSWEVQGWPDPQLRELIQAMRIQGRMLEQEWVLLKTQKESKIDSL